MSHLNVVIPKPKFAVGSLVIALINHQPRHAEVIQAYLSANFVLQQNGVSLMDSVRWEYDVLVISEPIEASERMLIAERTIIVQVNDHDNKAG